MTRYAPHRPRTETILDTARWGNFIPGDLTIAYFLFHLAVKGYDARRQVLYLAIDVLFAIFVTWVIRQ